MLSGDHWGRLHGGTQAAPASWEAVGGRDFQPGPGQPQLCGQLSDESCASCAHSHRVASQWAQHPSVRDGLRAVGALGQTSLPTLPGALDEAMPMVCFWNSGVLKL